MFGLFQQIHCSVILCLVSLTVILRYSTLYLYTDLVFSSQFCYDVVVNIWFILCIGNSISLYQGSLREDALPAFIQEWSVQADQTSLAYVYKKSFIYTLLCNSLQILCIALIGYQIFATNYRDEFILPLEHGTTIAYILKTVAFCIVAFGIAPWILTPMFVLFISHVFQYEYSAIGKELISMCEERCFSTKEFGAIRQRHQKLCKLVDHVDEIFSLHVANTLLANVGIICVTLFVVINDQEATQIDVTINTFWTLFCFTILMITLVAGARINTQVNMYILY